jgi:uncharacterized protein YidB (DUF937 family)
MTAPQELHAAVAGLASPAEQQAVPGLLDKLFSKETIEAIIAKLKEGGLAAEVKSWLDKAKQSIPVTAEQVREALGEERLKQFADKLGVSPETLAAILAYVLPTAAAPPNADGAPSPAPAPAPQSQPGATPQRET